MFFRAPFLVKYLTVVFFVMLIWLTLILGGNEVIVKKCVRIVVGFLTHTHRLARTALAEPQFLSLHFLLYTHNAFI